MRETVRVVEGVQVLGPTGLESIRYPHETLHEIITNAVLHRDYSIAADIQIRVFDNRIEVESPGCLPGHITTQNILTEQFARNGMIVRLSNAVARQITGISSENKVKEVFYRLRDAGKFERVPGGSVQRLRGAVR